jgi:hypothetical protein
MALRFVLNDCAKEVQPGVWCFRGPWVGALACGAVVSFMTFRLLAAYADVDLIPNVAVSALPLLLVTAFVYLFVDGHAPSHPIDLFVWLLHRLHVGLCEWGLVRSAPYSYSEVIHQSGDGSPTSASERERPQIVNNFARARRSVTNRAPVQ